MIDLEITRLCAEAMGWKWWRSKHGYWNVTDADGNDHICCNGWPSFDVHSGEKLREPTEADALTECDYDPLHDDAQAMALVKKHRINIYACPDAVSWRAECLLPRLHSDAQNLNRAICECAAKMQQAKVT